MERWRGRTALVTGASSGIGYAIAEELTKQGVNVIGCARRAEKIEELANKCANYTPGKDCSQGGCGKITAIKCDLTNEQDILQMFQRIEKEFGHVDILVNNAGTLIAEDVLTGETKGWKQMLDVTLLPDSFLSVSWLIVVQWLCFFIPAKRTGFSSLYPRGYSIDVEGQRR